MGIKSHFNKQILIKTLLLFAVLFMLTSLAFHLFIVWEKRVWAYHATQKTKNSLDASIINSQNNLHGMVNKLSILADFAEQNIYGDQVKFDNLINIYTTIGRKYPDIDQVRLLNINGREALRINFDDSSSYVCKETELQDKSQREYFKQGMKLGYGEVYVSPIDLNVENNAIEVPYKPVIRLVTPLRDKDGNTNFLFVINYRMRDVFQYLHHEENLLPYVKVELLNKDGYWLLNSREKDKEWGFILTDIHRGNIALDSPEIWQKMRNNRQGSIKTKNQIIIYQVLNWKDGMSQRVGFSLESKAGKADEPIYLLFSIQLDDLRQQYQNITLYHWHYENKFLLLFFQIITDLLISYSIVVLFHARHEMNKQRKYEQEKNKIILSSCPAAILTLDRDNKIVFSNDYVCNIFGYEADQLPDDIINSLVDFAANACKGTCAKELDCINEIEFSIRTRTGESKLLQCRFCWSSGNYTIYFFTDITEIKHNQQELVALNEELRSYTIELKQMAQFNESLALKAMETDKAQSLFLATMSHEIRTPLTAILGYTDLSLKLAADYPEIKNNLAVIHSNSGFLLNIINTLLDQEKIKSGKMKLHFAEMSIIKVLYSCSSIIQTLCDEKNISLVTEYEPLPVIIYSDSLRVQQCIMNLLGNAVKFTPQNGRIVISACLTELADGNYVKVAVADSGIGISREKQQSIFEPFEQLGVETDTAFAGTGLGLSITRQVVNLLGGEISVESEKGKGAKFTITIPAGTDRQLEVKDSYEQLSELAAEYDRGSETRYVGRVLVVDDTQTNLILFRMMLEAIGLIVDTANSGQEAIDRVNHNNKYDLIMLDLHMPEISGFDTFKEIKKLAPDLNILALTADALPATIAKCKQMGFGGIVFKPINRFQMDVQLKKFLQEETNEIEAVQNLEEDDSQEARSFIDPLETMKQLNIKMKDYIKALKLSYEDIQRLKKEVAAAIENNDTEAVRVAAHAIKNTAGTLSMKKVYENAKSLELLAVESRAGEYAQANQELTVVVDEVLQYIENRFFKQ